MCQKEITIHAKLLLSYQTDIGYKYYVFEDLEYTDPDYHYLTCVRLPNWEWRDIKEGEEGYLVYKFVQEGVDEWFDGNNFIKFKNTNLIFMRFMSIKAKNNEIIID